MTKKRNEITHEKIKLQLKKIKKRRRNELNSTQTITINHQ
jgi:hypothetical protein